MGVLLCQVTVSGKTLILNSTISTIMSPTFVNLLPNESVHFGDCIMNGDKVYFVFTSNFGNTYFVDLQQEHTTVLNSSSHTSAFVQHQVHKDSKLILFSNGSSTVLYNASCQTDSPYVIIIDHPYHLSLHLSEDRLHPCTCPPSEVHDSSNMETSTGSDDTKEDTGGITVGVILGILMLAILTMFSVLAVIVICYKR